MHSVLDVLFYVTLLIIFRVINEHVKILMFLKTKRCDFKLLCDENIKTL